MPAGWLVSFRGIRYIVAMESSKLDRAAAYLGKAEGITPGSERIATAQNSLQEKAKAAASDVTSNEEQQTSSSEQTGDSEEGMWGDMKKWYETQAEKNKAEGDRDRLCC